MAKLVIRYPDGSEQEADLAGQLTIGRAEGNDLVLAEGGVSRKHARFFTEGSDVLVEDTGSANGTWVDGEKISEPTRLGARAQVVIGDYEISVKMNGSAALAKRPAARPKPKVGEELGRPTGDAPAVKPPRATKVVPAVKEEGGGAALARRPGRPAPGASASSGPVLRGLTGPWLNKTWPLKGKLVVGRVPGVEVQIDDDSVSRRHAELTVVGREVRLSDLGSANGTLVNGAPVTEPIALAPGDIVQFGVVEATYEAPRSALVRRGGNASRTGEEGGEEAPPRSRALFIVAGVVVLGLVGGGLYKFLAVPPASTGPAPNPGNEQPLYTEADLDSLLEIARSNAAPDIAEPNWDKALEAVNKALEIEPIHSEANELKRRIVKERACKEAYDKGVKDMRLREEAALESFSKISEDCSYFFKVKPKIGEAVEQVKKKAKEDCDQYSGNGNWKEALPRCRKYMEFACQTMKRDELYPPQTQVLCLSPGRKKNCWTPKDKTYLKFLTALEKIEPTAPAWECPELPIFKKEKPPPDPGAMAKDEIKKRFEDKDLADPVTLYFDGKNGEAINALLKLRDQREKAKLHEQAKRLLEDIKSVDGLFKSGSTDLAQDDPEKAADAFREALELDERLVLGAEKAALPEAEKKAMLDRFQSYWRKNIQHDMARACYDKGRYYMDRKDDRRACRLWRLGFSFFRGDNNINKAVTNQCTTRAHEALQGANDCASLQRVLDYEVPGDGMKEEYEKRKAEMNCP